MFVVFIDLGLLKTYGERWGEKGTVQASLHNTMGKCNSVCIHTCNLLGANYLATFLRVLFLSMDPSRHLEKRRALYTLPTRIQTCCTCKVSWLHQTVWRPHWWLGKYTYTCMTSSYDKTLLPDWFVIIQVYRVTLGDFARAKWPKPPHRRVSASKK